MSYQISGSSSLQILNDPLNNSTSKFQFSFPKAQRFQKNQSYCNTAFYSKPEVKSKRSASFGYGQKSDFTQSTVISPAPVTYEKESQFERKISTARGKSFGLSRQSMDEFSYIPKHIQKNPGIGAYVQPPLIGKGSAQYSMRKKTLDPHQPVFLDGKRSYLQNPGPGQYESIGDMNQDGKFIVAKFRDSGASFFNPPSSRRFPNDQGYAPGPGTYQVKNGLDQEGKYVLSQYRGCGTRPFDQQSRKSFIDTAVEKNYTPGPGNYRMPSHFGHYDQVSFMKTSASRTQKGFRPSSSANLAVNQIDG